MPKAKYEPIYRTIKENIENGTYPSGDYLPSENEFCNTFRCTRNTVRRALSMLAQDGYILPQHGKGVQVIYTLNQVRNIFTIGGIESFAETVRRNNAKIKTKVISFKEVIADDAISLETGFDKGVALFHLERLRFIDKKAVILDNNYFLKSETPGLSKAIAAKSVYQYLEDELHMNITTSRRRITAEKATAYDEQYLDLESYDFLLVVVGQVFNSKGIMFEYTQSRHRPDYVCFVQSAIRQK